MGSGNWQKIGEWVCLPNVAEGYALAPSSPGNGAEGKSTGDEGSGTYLTTIGTFII